MTKRCWEPSAGIPLKAGHEPAGEDCLCADYIEPRRDKAPNLKEIRKLAFMDLDLALLKILEDTLGYLGDSPEEVDSMTRETYEYYKAQIKG